MCLPGFSLLLLLSCLKFFCLATWTGISTGRSLKIPAAAAGDSTSVSGPSSVYNHLDQLIRDTMDLSQSSLRHSMLSADNDRLPVSDQR